jgi:beta-lactamase regulating signal transducer with metallopeptidase domain
VPSETIIDTVPVATGVQGPEGNTMSAKPSGFIFFLTKYQNIIWLMGAALYSCWFIAAYIRFVRNIKKTCVQPHINDMELFDELRGRAHVRLSCNSHIDTPMLIGFISPCIVIPQLAFVRNGMKAEFINIIRHELTHYLRRALLYKWIAS